MENKKHDIKNQDFYAEALRSIDTPAPKKAQKKGTLGLVAAIVAAAVLIAALLLWQPWEGESPQPSSPSTAPTEPLIHFDYGIIFRYLPDVYGEDDLYAMDTLELSEQDVKHIMRLLDEEKWFDTSMLTGEVYPIGSFELVQSGQSHVYEFTANGLVIHNGKYACMEKTWSRLTMYMIQADGDGIDAVYSRETKAAQTQMLYFDTEHLVSLVQYARPSWSRHYVQAGEYILLLGIEKLGFLTMRRDGETLTYIEPYSDPQFTALRHGDSFQYVRGDAGQLYGHAQIGNRVDDMYFPYGKYTFDKAHFMELRRLLESFTWKESDGSDHQGESLAVSVQRTGYEYLGFWLAFMSDDTIVLNQYASDTKMEAVPTAEQRRQLLSLIAAQLPPMEWYDYVTKEGVEPSQRIIFDLGEERGFQHWILNEPSQYGVYLKTETYVFLFYDNGRFLLLRPQKDGSGGYVLPVESIIEFLPDRVL